MSHPGDNPATTSTSAMSKKRKQLIVAILAGVLIVALVAGVVAGVNTSGNKDNSHHAIIKTACSSTLYPDFCFATLATQAPPHLSNSKVIRTHKNVIELSLNITTTAVHHNYYDVQRIRNKISRLTERERTALHDCLDTIRATLEELHQVVKDLEEYPSKKSLKQHADDLKTLMSSAITNQETCLDGFSHDQADKKIRKVLLKGLFYVEKLCSNALAMIKSMTDADIANEMKLAAGGGRKLEEEESANEWPEWLSAGDRKLLQSSNVQPDVVVAADGSGNYRTVSAAVAAAPARSTRRYVIRIKAGAYRENVEVPSNKPNIMFMGDGRGNTIITAFRNVVDGSTTYNSATVAVVGDNFLARDLTFQNTAGPSKHQAVALRANSDKAAFYRCGFLAFQDTLYVHSNRQFIVNSVIVGTVDFIFGNSAVVIQNSDIFPRRPNPGQQNMVTAQGRTDPNQNTGIVIQKCRIQANNDLLPVQGSVRSYLGRPWKEYSRTVVMQSTISNVIDPAGWHEWDGNFALNTLYYGEYQNRGAGASTSRRVSWRGYRVITSASEAQTFTAGRFIAGGSWLGSTGFPFSLGL